MSDALLIAGRDETEIGELKMMFPLYSAACEGRKAAKCSGKARCADPCLVGLARERIRFTARRTAVSGNADPAFGGSTGSPASVTDEPDSAPHRHRSPEHLQANSFQPAIIPDETIVVGDPYIGL